MDKGETCGLIPSSQWPKGEREMSVKPLRDQAGELQLNWRSILAAAGYGGPTEDWEVEGGKVYHIYLGERNPRLGPYSEASLRKEAKRIVTEGRRWCRQAFPGLVRSLELDEFNLVQLYRQARRADIQRVRVGEEVRVGYSTGSYFGRGGGWGNFMIYGDVDQEQLEESDNGFVRGGAYKITFSKGPAAVYSAAGDSINGGRTHYKILIVAE